jgi:hypothetical protein
MDLAAMSGWRMIRLSKPGISGKTGKEKGLGWI